MLLVVSFALPSRAQGPYFKKIELPSGLDDAQIELTTQCADGFIWTGTENGLYRYDGLRMSHFTFAADSLDNHVTAICPSSGDSIWLGYNSGMIGLFTAAGLEPVKIPAAATGRKITDILYDSRGTAWFATYGQGIHVLQAGRWINITTGSGLSDDYVYCLEESPDGSIWAGTDKGINICRTDNGAAVIGHLAAANGLPDNIVTTLVSDGKSTMYAGMYKEGICAVDMLSREVRNLFAAGSWNNGAVQSCVLLNNELWIAAEGREIVQYVLRQPSYIRFYDEQHGLPPGGARHISVDDEGNLWIVSDNSQVTKVNLLFEIIDRHEDVDFNNIHALLADRNGGLWLFNGRDLIRHSTEFTGRNTIRLYELPLQDKMQVISLYEDDLGHIWAGTFGQGIFRIDPASGQYLRMDKSHGLVDDNILGISGSGDQIWFATLAGASYIKSGDVRPGGPFHFRTAEGDACPGKNYVYSVFTDANGDQWFATDGNGLVHYRKGQCTEYSARTGHLNSSVVYSITGDSAGNIWFSTLKEGIYRFDGSQFVNYDAAAGLTDPDIAGLVIDEEDNLIIAHRKGVDILDLGTGKFSYYSEQYGLGDINPDLNTASVDINGDVWLGTRKALIKYAGHSSAARRRPRTTLAPPKVFLEPHDFNSQPALHSKQNHLTFEFAGLWFQHPEAVTYQYKLDGYDPEWVTTRNNTVIYPNLPPGHYRFAVRSSADRSFDNAASAVFEFAIRPPLWKTWWFMLGMAIIVFTALYYLFSAREKRTRKQEQREKERILLEFENLKSQVNPHFLFNSFNSLISVIEDDQDKAVEYVEKLSQFFRNILTYRDEELISVQEELDIVKDYFFIHQQRYGELVGLHLSVKDVDLARLIPPLTLQILIENAIKHNVISRAHPLRVEIASRDGGLSVRNKIKAKRTQEASTGTGLQNIRNRYRLLTDLPLTIHSGTEYFEVIVPLIKQPS
jgi:ligand-binding sensor domain-containing protein